MARESDGDDDFPCLPSIAPANWPVVLTQHLSQVMSSNSRHMENFLFARIALMIFSMDLYGQLLLLNDFKSLIEWHTDQTVIHSSLQTIVRRISGDPQGLFFLHPRVFRCEPKASRIGMGLM